MIVFAVCWVPIQFTILYAEYRPEKQLQVTIITFNLNLFLNYKQQILLEIKSGLHSYCKTTYSSGSVNQMWIQTISKYIQSKNLSCCDSNKIFDFSKLYTSLPHSKLKDKLKELVLVCFILLIMLKKRRRLLYRYL